MYKALLKYGILDANKISKLTTIPLSRIYDVAESLQAKGLILVSRIRPKQFKALSPSIGIQNLIKYEENELNEKIHVLKENAETFIKTLSSIADSGKCEEERWYVWSIDKNSNAESILNEQKKAAKYEIKVFSGNLSWINIPDAKKIIKQLVKNGVKVRILICDPKNDEVTRKNLMEAKEAGATVKCGYTSEIRGHIVDDKIAALIIRKNCLKEDDENYELMTITNPTFIKALSENFEFWWAKAKNA